MNSAMVRVEMLGDLGAVPLAVVELDRRAGVCSHPVFGRVDVVDHLVAWVFEDGLVLAAVMRRSALCGGRLLRGRELNPAHQVALSATERLDVMHAAGIGTSPAPSPESVRWEVA